MANEAQQSSAMSCTGHGHGHECNDDDDDDAPFGTQRELHSDPDERLHFESVCASFRQYATFARTARTGRIARIRALPESQRALLPPALIPGTDEHRRRDEAFQEAEIRNQFFFDSMLRHAGVETSQDVVAKLKKTGGGAAEGARSGGNASSCWSSDETMSKVSSVLKSLQRDWSEEGSMERSQSYTPIIEGFQKYLPHRDGAESAPRVVVPGAGVGRLALELSAKGYEVQGCEFSLHMLLASDFILNSGCSPQSRQFAISPWLAETRNVTKAADQTRKIFVPDIDPASFLDRRDDSGDGQQPEFSMAAGEFISIYGKPEERGRWDGVACCFFLDTAPCVAQYIQVMYDMLAEGGVLVNFGPLLFHWSGPPVRPDDESAQAYSSRHSHMDKRYMESVDMSWDDVRDVILRAGFTLLVEEFRIPAQYTADSKSMMSTTYHCVYFVARKERRG